MSALFEGLRTPFEVPPAGGAVEVAEGILWLRLPLPMKLDHVNVYALAEPEGWTIVDTGLAWGRARAAWETLRAGPLGGRPVVRVVATHHHPDHIGLAARFIAEGAELWTTRTAWLYARMLTLDHHERPTPQAIRFARRAGYAGERLEAYANAEPFNFSRSVEPMPPGFRRIVEGETITMGGRDWHVRMGHGHAPEQATFWSADGRLVLSGDQVLPRISPNIGVHATEPEADPLAEWLASCRRLAGVATEAQLCLPGHNAPFTGLPLRLHQLIENHEGALTRLRRHIAEAPRCATECFVPLFGREMGEGEYGLAASEAVAHLNYLMHRGEAVAEEDGAGALRFRLASASSC